MKKIRLIPLLVLIFLAAVLSGCGINDEREPDPAAGETEMPTEAPTEADTVPPVDPATLGEPAFVYENGKGSALTCYAGASEDAYWGARSYFSSLGYTLYSESRTGGVLAATYRKDAEVMHVYYDSAAGELNVSHDADSELPEPVPAQNAAYPSVSVTQIADKQKQGMGYILRLTDGSFIIVDGGSDPYEFDKTLTELNGGRDVIHIRLWLLTVSCSDHYQAFDSIAASTNGFAREPLQVDCVAYCPVNSTNVSIKQPSGNSFVMHHDYLYFSQWRFDDAVYPCRENGTRLCVLHTGMTFSFPGCRLEILLTGDDMFGRISDRQFEAASTVCRFTAPGGVSMLMLSDANAQSADRMRALYGDSLKSDICQAAGHGESDFPPEVYDLIRPSILLYPCAQWAYDLTTDAGVGVRAALREASYVKEIIVRDEKTSTCYLEDPIRTETTAEPEPPAPSCDHSPDQPNVFVDAHRDANCFAVSYTMYRCNVCCLSWTVDGTEKPEHEFVDGFCVLCGLNEDADTFFKVEGSSSSSKTYYISGFTDDFSEADRRKDTIILPTVGCYNGRVAPVTSVTNVFNQFSYTEEELATIRKVVVPEGYTMIGDGTFAGLTGLEEVVLPSTLTKIGNNAFANDTSLKRIVIPENVTYIGAEAFRGCKVLEEIVLPDGCTSIGRGAFRECGLCSIRLPSSLRSIADELFWGLAGLKEIEIPESVTVIGMNAFSYTGITQVTIPSSVTTFSLQAFDRTDIRELILPDSVTALTEFMGERNEFPALEVIRLSDNLTTFPVLSHLPKLKRINIPDALERIDVPMFEHCPALEEIEISPDHLYFTLRDGMLISKKDKKLVGILGTVTELIIPDDGSVLEIGDDACRGRTSLERVVIPGSVRTVCASAFLDCTSLASVELGKGIKTLEYYCFYGCTSLTSLVLPVNVAVGPRVLADCTSLREVTIPTKIMVQDFYPDLAELFEHDTALECVHYLSTVSAWEKLDNQLKLTSNMPAGTVIRCTDGEVVVER